MRVLDRSFFQKQIPTVAARIFNPKQTAQIVKDCADDLLRLRRINPMSNDPENPGRKLLLLHPLVKMDGTPAHTSPASRAHRLT